jgi:uncharacterized protein
MTMERNLVGWFEIPVTEMDRAQRFYELVFDITLERVTMDGEIMAWFPANGEVYGAGGTLVQGPNYVPSIDGCQLYFSSQDIDAILSRVVEGGGEILQPTTSIGKHGFIGYFKDSEGNKIGLHMNVADETPAEDETA